MSKIVLAAVALAATTSLSIAQDTANQEGPPPRQLRVRAVEEMVQGVGDASLRQFIETHVAPAYRDSFAAPDTLMRHFGAIRGACAGFGGILVDPVGEDESILRFLRDGSETVVTMRLDPEPPHQIVALTLQSSEARAKKPEVAPITWENLGARLDEEAARGFAGTVLVVRDGKTVLHRGYGQANRERNIPNGAETIFAVGSVPIDFTRAAILKLEQLGKLSTGDPVANYFSTVPTDKQSMTIDHLMSGRSGLPDFHHIAGVDADRDLSWIDRETAITRILGAPLRFSPGEDEAHSHSAWVLLAAIVEIVSKQSYIAFLREHFFEPSGMTRTGNHEDCERFSDDEFAVGYEGQKAGKLNIPKYWGKTSWLVMGSGGMQSTPMDLYRWNQAIRAHKTLSSEAARKYWHGGVLVGGDDRGFFCIYNEGPGDMFILCSNAHRGRGDVISGVGRRLVDLVTGR